MLSLGVDTSNYASSVAVVDPLRGAVVCSLKKLLPVGEGELGLRQSDAVFQHVKALPALFDELQERAPLREVEFVGVSKSPRDAEGSYMPCFLAGVAAASAFAAARGVRLRTASHQRGHVAAALLGAGGGELFERELLFLHMSGGTTELLLTRGDAVLRRLGGTLDLAAGQVVDRIGVRLGCAFPAGGELSDIAAACDEPVSPRAAVRGADCHFSGLQNQCEALLSRGKSAAHTARFCLQSVAKTAELMLEAARRQYPGLTAVCAGGVMCSTVIREYIGRHCENVCFAPPQLSADNAVGVALIAAREARYG